MTPQVTESYIESTSQQADGTILVVERHVISDGRIVTKTYYAQNESDIQPIMQAMAVKIQADLDAKARITAEAHNYELPLSRRDFIDRYTLAEQGVIQTQYLTFMSNPNYTDEIKGHIAAGKAYFDAGNSVYLSSPLTIAGVQLHEALGWIAPGRANEILGIV
ncbi:MAG: hypothetical protein PHT48_09575 [Dechloromonas sp.]|nr:hypothetical protein [Dechloromonas sp.]